MPHDDLKIKTNFNENFSVSKLKTYIKELNKIEKGCILEVDLEYLKELHDDHNDFPFFLQNTKLNNQKVSKLMNTFFDKKNVLD